MTTHQPAKNPDHSTVLWLLAAASGFLAAPHLQSLASIPVIFCTEYVSRTSGSGGTSLSPTLQALLMVATYALHALLFGFFVMFVSLGKAKFRSIYAVIAMISCTAWLIWIQTQSHPDYSAIVLSKHLLELSSTFANLSFTSFVAMVAACITRIIQDFLSTRISSPQKT